MVEVAPEEFGAWFEAGLYSKARGEWAESAERNARAVALFTENDARRYDGVNPAAWNLGIAATAVGDWAVARRAWAAYGIEGIAAGAEPIDNNFGLTPVRLNPDRPSLKHQVPVGIGDTEVVWCWRRSPAHAVIASVPLPGSGHRFRDVVLHDGEPKGYRRHGDQEVAVFDELARLDESGLQTWQAQVLGATTDDLGELEELVGSRGLGMEEWSGIRLMCSDCSHGTPEAAHDHAPASSGAAVVGLAGSEAELTDCLEDWRADRPHVTLAELTFLW
ncbi:tetratricopeptide repeat protein [Kribbella capetownensis]|uniref:Tetratricopeptide repeat protein n=1 Tax=Kribbella capetownensis TaxID=1572659 RepID=A0A4R0IIU8_9ACTN|nr:tetratricopeptide repeat protein [Kribbella capetownensis]TCC32100.1 tetratricopeptide repeat protein [Kribbella capetownensis]